MLCYPIPLLLGRQNMGDPSHASFAVAELLRGVLNALPDETFRVLAISANQMRASSLIMAFTRTTSPYY